MDREARLQIIEQKELRPFVGKVKRLIATCPLKRKKLSFYAHPCGSNVKHGRQILGSTSWFADGRILGTKVVNDGNKR